jgi:hypothetical protein
MPQPAQADFLNAAILSARLAVAHRLQHPRYIVDCSDIPAAVKAVSTIATIAKVHTHCPSNSTKIVVPKANQYLE